jgi:hypothetical protein
MKATPRYDALGAQRVANAERQEKLLADGQRRRKPVDAALRNPVTALRNPSRNPPSRNLPSRKSEPTESRNGRPPIGDRAMTPAQRQAQYRARKRQAEAGR